MSVMIKGIDMPKSCRKCDFRYNLTDFTKMCKYVREACHIRGMLDNCPLIEVPSKHGRLIDADGLLAVMKSAAGNQVAVPLDAVLAQIDNAPVVIEAEGIKV